MSRPGWESRNYYEDDRTKRKNLGQKLKDGLSYPIYLLKNLLPEKRNVDDYYDYFQDNIPRKNSVPAVKIAMRVLMSGSVVAGATAAWFNRDSIVDAFVGLKDRTVEAQDVTSESDLATATPILTNPTPTATEEICIKEELGYSRNEFGVVINYDSDGVPLSYDSGIGLIEIDQNEIKRLKALAKTEQLPQLIAWTYAPERAISEVNKQYIPSTDRPLVSELPKDILTEEELESRGVSIIQGEKVKLHLRESAFGPDGSLSNFKEDGKNKLTIVLVDGPSISRAYMKDSKYYEVRNLAVGYDMNVENYRTKEIEFWKEMETEAINQLRESEDQLEKYSIQGQIIFTKVMQKQYESASPESLAIESGMTEYAGLYDPSTRTVFVAVGKNIDTDQGKTQIILYMDTDGNVQVTNSTSLGGNQGFVPQLYENFPRPSDFSYNSETGEDAPSVFPEGINEEGLEYKPKNLFHYPYGGQMPSQVLRHEIEHDEIIMANSDYTDPFKRRSEWFTDMSTMGDIDEAFEQFKKSGYTDDSLYWIVFEVDGQIILGKNRPTDVVGVN